MDEKMKELYSELSKNAVQRTDGNITKKGYDTTGYGYQYCVDKLNEVYGSDWGYDYDIINHDKGKFNNGTQYHDITVNLGIWIEKKDNVRSCAGGHISKIYADALKGAITNAFKKTAAFWGVGSDAYRGTIDDDNEPYPDKVENKVENKAGTYADFISKIKQCDNLEILLSISNLIQNYTWTDEALSSLRTQFALKRKELEGKIHG